jgi:hypothetical protein
MPAQNLSVSSTIRIIWHGTSTDAARRPTRPSGARMSRARSSGRALASDSACHGAAGRQPQPACAFAQPRSPGSVPSDGRLGFFTLPPRAIALAAFRWPAGRSRVIGLPRTRQSRRARRDDCIARMIRKQNHASLTADVALLSSGMRLLVRHASARPVAPTRRIAFAHNEQRRQHRRRGCSCREAVATP